MPTAKVPIVPPVVQNDALSAAYVGGLNAGVRQTANAVSAANSARSAAVAAADRAARMQMAQMEMTFKLAQADSEARSRNAALSQNERLAAAKQAHEIDMFMRGLDAQKVADASKLENQKTLEKYRFDLEQKMRAGDPAEQLKSITLGGWKEYEKLQKEGVPSDDPRLTDALLRMSAGTSAFSNLIAQRQYNTDASTGELLTPEAGDKFWLRRTGGDIEKAMALQSRYENVLVPAFNSALQKVQHWGSSTGSLEAMQEHARAVNDLIEAKAQIQSFWPPGEDRFNFDEDLLLTPNQRMKKAEAAANTEAVEEEKSGWDQLREDYWATPYGQSLFGQGIFMYMRNKLRGGGQVPGTDIPEPAVRQLGQLPAGGDIIDMPAQEAPARSTGLGRMIKSGAGVIQDVTTAPSALRRSLVSGLTGKAEEFGESAKEVSSLLRVFGINQAKTPAPVPPNQTVITNTISRLPQPGKGAVRLNPETGKYEVTTGR